MSDPISRRHFLQSGLALGGAGLTGNLLPVLQPLELTGDTRYIHDPVIIKDGERFYCFCTGPGIRIRESADLLKWEKGSPGKLFDRTPDWVRAAIPNQNDMWAPDVAFFNERFYLYYSVSTFGSNRSVIGLVTNPTLDSQSPDYGWVDEGLILESTLAGNYNCIDPNFILDADGNPWLAFGSFWSGIKLRRLDATGKPSSEDTTLYALAQRTVNSGAIEAPFIIYRDGFYYLFASFDFCCRGIESSYYVVVGRSTEITGPYVDRAGGAMLEGGGTPVTFPTERWRGPGHCAVLREGDVDYLVYHAYDAQNLGTPTLHISRLSWDADGWPAIDPLE